VFGEGQGSGLRLPVAAKMALQTAGRTGGKRVRRVQWGDCRSLGNGLRFRRGVDSFERAGNSWKLLWRARPAFDGEFRSS